MNKNNLRIRNYNRYCIFVHSEEILVCEFQDRIDFLNISIFLIFNSGYHDFFH
jgi:transglutaminase/protease-like cytokinesis protein 3